MGVEEAEVLDLPGVPDGLVAIRVRRFRTDADGQRVEQKSRRGLKKVEAVELVARQALPLSLEAREEQWVLGAGRRKWSTVQARYGAGAQQRATELARAGAVRLICPVDDTLQLREPTHWLLTEAWQQRADESASEKASDREHWSERAHEAAASVRLICPGLATALTAQTTSTSSRQVLVYAAEDLAAGVVHDGPRAFSQAHFAATKAHDDVAAVLRRAGAGEEAITALGVRRSSRLGVAGPIGCLVHGEPVELQRLHGPVLLRADQPGLALAITDAPLVIVENLQAAEVLADQLADIAVIYTAGPPSDPALALLRGLRPTAGPQLLVPDADLGGVRIAERVLAALPNAQVFDIGSQPHPPAVLWPTGGISQTGLEQARDGFAGVLAVACLARGYPVEQELATVRAVKAALGLA